MKQYTVVMTVYDYTKKKPKQLNKMYKSIMADDNQDAIKKAKAKWNKPDAEVNMVWANYSLNG